MSANNVKASETLNILWSKLQHKRTRVGASNEVSTAGVGKEASKAVSGKRNKIGVRFTRAKKDIIDDLRRIHNLSHEQQSVVKCQNSKEAIAAQSEIRGLILNTKGQWNNLESLYKK